jgi:arylsulfatase A-like enzyme
MVSSLRSVSRRHPLLLPVVGLLALALLVAGALVAKLHRSAGSGDRDVTAARLPANQNTASPDQVVPSASPRPQQSGRPNLVTVLTDDMRADDLRWMPHVRRLVQDQGLDFRNSFASYPLCAPARASLMTGEFSHNHHVFSHVEPYGFGALDDRRTIATSLNDAGYNTLFLGKYLNGYGVQDSLVTGQPSFRYVPPGWTDWRASVERPANSGFASGGTYQYYDLLVNKNGTIDDSHKGRYQSAVQGRMASRMVREYHRSPKPFFLYWAPIAPHFGLPRESDDPSVTWPDGEPELVKTPARPPAVRGVFDREIQRASGLPQDGGPAEQDVSDKPHPIDELPELSDAERVAVRTLTRQRAEALFALDAQVAKLVHTLKATHEYANTVIMFTSDNGYFLGEHRLRQGKIKPHEPSLRVPFLIAGDGIPHGDRFDPVTTEDVAATLLDLGHARPPHPLDGQSVVPSFARDRGWRSPVLTEGLETSPVFRDAAASPAPGFTDARTTIGIRTSRWKYVRYNDGEGELYDLDADANELTNLFGDPQHAAVQAELEQVWVDHKDCRGVSCAAPLPADLRGDPEQERAAWQRQARSVDARYGYSR